MRALLAVMVLAACGPKVAPKATVFDEELPAQREAVAEETPVVAEARPVAPPGKGMRSGTIERARLNAILDGGPGAFLRQLEIAPRMNGNRFVGWQLVQLLDRTGPLYDVDVAPGDVLLAVNGKPLSRPDQLQTVWDSLRTANELRAQLWRGDAKLELAFAIEPKVDPSTVPTPAARPAAQPKVPPPAARPAAQPKVPPPAARPAAGTEAPPPATRPAGRAKAPLAPSK